MRSLRLEGLEDRTTPAAVSWDGGGDGTNWTDARNWSGDVLPGASDAVTIPAGGPAVSYLDGTTTVSSLTSSRPLSIAVGTLTVTGPAAVTDLTTTGGALVVGGPTTATGAVTVSGGTVTLNGPATAECGMVVEGPKRRVAANQRWEVLEEGRPARTWTVAGSELVNGTSCVKLVAAASARKTQNAVPT